ncbi:MAG: translation initiation factor [Bacteroidia bacterium]|nr:translation initiation factor [Bacteroidia bacterium]MDW8014937.1 translation initiation factor [Bacteroidia bacterium]
MKSFPKDRLVFSTKGIQEEEVKEPSSPPRQNLRVLRRKIAGGKEVTEITGFVGPLAELEALAKRLRQMCATGGSIAEGKIILQGNQVDRIICILTKEGHIVKRSGG